MKSKIAAIRWGFSRIILYPVEDSGIPRGVLTTEIPGGLTLRIEGKDIG